MTRIAALCGTGFFALSLLSSTAAFAERVDMKNGDRLTGQVVLSKSASFLRLKTPYGSVNLPVAAVKDVYSDKNLSLNVAQLAAAHAAPAAIKVAKAKPPAAMKLALVPYPASNTPTPASAASGRAMVAAIPSAAAQPQPPGLWGAKWKNKVDFGGNYQTGNTRDHSINADFDTEPSWDKDRAHLNGAYDWEENNGTRSQDNWMLDTAYDHFMQNEWFPDGKWYANANANLKQDELADLRLRSSLGTGLGRQFYRSDALNLKAILGPSWLRQQFTDAPTKDSLAARFALDYDQKFYKGLFQLFHDDDVFVPTNDFGGDLVDSDSGIRIPLKGGLVGTAEWKFNFNAEPAPGAKPVDNRYMLKLGYQW